VATYKRMTFEKAAILLQLLALFLYNSAGVRADETKSAVARPVVRIRQSSEQPKVMLWSWQKIEDLRAINTTTTGVAYLAGRFVVDGGKIALEPRLSRLQLAPGCYREAVTRVEVKTLAPASEQGEVAARLARLIVNLIGASGPVNSLQIDFDARYDERAFYLQLLRELHDQLPRLPLSITALASWSQGDRWLEKVDNLPVDFMVPMFFTMGAGKEQALANLQSELPGSLNGRRVLGVSLSEPATIELIAPRLGQLDHLYLFCSPGWTKERIRTAANLIQQKLLKESN
jgi:hypothetical protein